MSSSQLPVETTIPEEKFPKVDSSKNTKKIPRNQQLEIKSSFHKKSCDVWITRGKETPISDLKDDELERIFRIAKRIGSDSARLAERFESKATHFGEIQANLFTEAMQRGLNPADWLKRSGEK